MGRRYLAVESLAKLDETTMLAGAEEPRVVGIPRREVALVHGKNEDRRHRPHHILGLNPDVLQLLKTDGWETAGLDYLGIAGVQLLQVPTPPASRYLILQSR